MKGTPLLEAGLSPHGIEVPRLSLQVQSDNERGSHGEDYYCGDRFGKAGVRAARGRRCGAGGREENRATRAADANRSRLATVPNRHGGLLGGTRMGTALSRAG